MYSVSDAFITASKQPIQTHRVVGTIGSVSFDDSNIVQGTFNITNQCSDTSDVTLGSVYTGTLTATFHGVNINRYAWINKVITPYFGMQLANLTWEEIPLGVFTVKEARHTANGVEVTAYDNMIKLDKKFKKSKFKDTGKMFEHISTICTACGIYLANTEAEIQTMPNGNTECGIVGTKSNSSLKKRSNDIETYRDLVYWIAQTMACFATMDRSGMLKFVRYQDENATVDTITEAHQLVGASFNDYVTRYTGIYVTNSVDDEELYYGYDLATLNAELTTATNTLSTITSDLADLEGEYEQGQITEEEYLAQKKTLNKQKRNIEKRIAWLNKAIANVEDGEEDGAYLELGCNPILQPDGVGATYTTMRTNVLNALDTISYTPFTCDTVCGVHYDLGDVLQFTGGHAGSGECCCLMCYDWTLHGAYSMQGFGQDPALQAVKSKTAKSANKASKSSNEASRSYTSTDDPTDGNDGDIYTKVVEGNVYGYVAAEVVTVGSNYTNFSCTGDEESGYTVTADMNVVGSTAPGQDIIFKYDNLEVGATYTLTLSVQMSGDMNRVWNHSSYAAVMYKDTGVTLAAIPYGQDGEVYDAQQAYTPHEIVGFGISFYADNEGHGYAHTFQALDSTMYLNITAAKLMGPINNIMRDIYIGNLRLYKQEGSQVTDSYPDKINVDGEWRDIEYVRGITPTRQSGDAIATIKNKDGTTTTLYGAGEVSANTSETPTVFLESITISDTTYDTRSPVHIDSDGYIAIDYDLVRTES